MLKTKYNNFGSYIKLATSEGWNTRITTNLVYKKIVVLHFWRDGVDLYINIHKNKIRVTSEMHHPKKGKTELTRKSLTEYEFFKIIQNPRFHTCKGKYILKPLTWEQKMMKKLNQLNKSA